MTGLICKTLNISYGLDIEKQNQLLMKMNAFCLAMRVNINSKPSSKLLHFQKGG